MDPLTFGDVEALRMDPLARARAHAADIDPLEKQAEAAKRQAERDAAKTNRDMGEAVARAEIARWGHSTYELALLNAQREGARLTQIRESEAQLDRLHPERRAAREAEDRRMSRAAREDAEIARARAVTRDKYMLRQVEGWHVREIERRSHRPGAREIVR